MEFGRKLVCDLLASWNLVPSLLRTGSEPALNLLRTSSELAPNKLAKWNLAFTD